MGRRGIPPDAGERQYRRGAVMGLTVAEIFMLLAFTLMMLLMLWRTQAAEQVAAAEALAEMPPEARQRFAELTAGEQDGLAETMEMVVEMQGSAPGRALLEAFAAAPEEERRRLVELAADTDLRSAIRARLAAAEDQRAGVAEALRRELGAAVAGRGGEIEADGSIVFPDSVLFEAGSATITPDLRGFLVEVCPRWMGVLQGSGAAISDLRIEGHASSEWDRSTGPDQAYLHNLALSQARAHAVLSTCLSLVPGAEGAWARERATAAGYSSSRPVLDADGQEDAAKSRRVVFGVSFDEGRVLDAIGSDLDAGAPPAARPQNASR